MSLNIHMQGIAWLRKMLSDAIDNAKDLISTKESKAGQYFAYSTRRWKISATIKPIKVPNWLHRMDDDVGYKLLKEHGAKRSW